VVGGLLGGIAVWLAGAKHRLHARRLRKRVWALENQVAVLRKQEEAGRTQRYSAEQPIMAQSATG
jgi:hypothetical protein